MQTPTEGDTDRDQTFTIRIARATFSEKYVRYVRIE